MERVKESNYNLRYLGLAGAWTISRWKTVRLLALPSTAVVSLLHHKKNEDWVDLSQSLLLFAAFVDSTGLTPRYLPFRLNFDRLLLASTGVGGALSLWHGEKWYHLLVGVAALYQAVSNGLALARGVALFEGLDPMQQTGILKNRALHTLSLPKKGRAIVIDGLWEPGFRNRPAAAAVESIYEQCDVLYYRVSSVKELETVLGDATTQWGAQADLLVFNGHANPDIMVLGGGYRFSADWLEVRAIQKAVVPGGQVVLFGCNTATGATSLTERLSWNLSNLEVVGITAYLNPFVTTQWFWNGRFYVTAHFPLSSQGLVVPWSGALSFGGTHS